jgi:hypothetical protein
MNALMPVVEELSPNVPSETEDFTVLWDDEEFINELMEAINENFVLEVESSRRLAQRALNHD